VADLPAVAGKSASFSTVFLEEHLSDKAANFPEIRGFINLQINPKSRPDT